MLDRDDELREARSMRFNTDRVTTKFTRDTALFVAGIAGIAHETLVSNVDRPTLLILFGGMVGLPVFLRTDEKAAEDKKPETPAVENTAAPPKAGQ